MHRALPLVLVLAGGLAAADLTLIDFAQPGVESRVAANGGADTTFALADGPRGKALEVTCTPGQNAWPGVALKPADAAWDLSAYGYVQAGLTNLSDQVATLCLRVDNPGDWQLNPWSAENLTLQPGKSGIATVWFGFSWGNPGYKLDPSKVSQLLVFTTKPKAEQKFRIDALRAGGQPGAKPPGFVQPLKPAGGVLLDLAAPRAESHGTVTTAAGDHVHVAFSPADPNPRPSTAFVCPPGTLWDLSTYNQVELTLRNPGQKELRLTCRVDNRWANGKYNCTSAEATLAAGETRTVTVPFAPAEPWDGSVKGSGSQFASDAVAGVLVATAKPAEPGAVDVLGIRAAVAPPQALPDWLGTRPPVPGDWAKTFEDTFDGPALSTERWSWPYPDPRDVWDKNAVDVAANAFVENGLMKIRAQVHQGEREDPQLRSRRYDTCVVSTFDKFRQRYGYFEARMKLPTAPGLWPAFWMMPDRGKESGLGFWPRQDTHDGGMEIDVMEYLVRFGPFRYNLAMHWDGYAKDHQSIGTERVYFQPDQDGYVTSGLLWEPGKLTFYGNGQVVGQWANARVPTVPCFLQFTLPTGGWGQCPVDETKLPDTLDVDWVRVWQRADWKSAGP